MDFQSSSEKLKLAKANSAAAEKEKREKAAQMQVAAKKREVDKASVQRTSQLAVQKIEQDYKIAETDYSQAVVMAERHGKQVQHWDTEVKKYQPKPFAPFDMEIGSDEKNASDGRPNLLDDFYDSPPAPTRVVATPKSRGGANSKVVSKGATPNSGVIERDGSERDGSGRGELQTPTSRTSAAKITSKEGTPKSTVTGRDEEGARGGTSKSASSAKRPPSNSVAATLARLRKEQE